MEGSGGPRTHYAWMIKLHVVVKYLFYLAVLSGIIHLAPNTLFAPVWLNVTY